MRQDGFTLLELMAAVIALTLIMALASANYVNFNRKTTLQQAALTLKSNLRSVQFRAINGQKPEETCTQLNGYTVSFTASTYSYQASCTPTNTDTAITTVELPRGVTFSPVPSSVLYKVLGLGIDRSTQMSVSLVNSDQTYVLGINPNGEIVDEGFE
jgi:prepilin-type N-terminal cleavage/methylation domain-containing protein